MRHDLLSDALAIIQNAENVGLDSCTVANSKLVRAVLEVAQRAGYISQIKQAGYDLTVTLAGNINTMKAIKPRFGVRKSEYEKFEKRYLPSHEIGLVIVSTSQGMMTHREASEKGLGGRLIAFVY